MSQIPKGPSGGPVQIALECIKDQKIASSLLQGGGGLRTAGRGGR